MRILDRHYGRAVWILTGFCFALAGALMLLCGTFHLDRFYDVGDIYDVPRSAFEINDNETMQYDAAERVWKVTDAVAVKHTWLTRNKWKYACLVLSEVSGGSFDATVRCYNKKGEQKCQADVVLSEGDNLLALPGVRYSRFDLVIEHQVGLSFRIEKMQFRQQPPRFSKRLFARYVLALSAAFYLVTGLIFLCFKRRLQRIPWHAPVRLLLRLFLKVGEYGAAWSGRLSAKGRGRMRSGIFCFLLLFIQTAFLIGIYNQIWFVLMAVCMAGFAAIAFLCYEKPLHLPDWNNKLVASFLLLWLLSLISDALVAKNQFSFMGIGMALGMGFLFFMWGNMRRRELLLRDFVRGVQWTFLPNVLFCYLFRPFIPGYRYSGAAINPGYFGMYLLFVWLAFLAELEFDFRNKSVRRADLFRILMLGVCGNMLWKTQSISSMLPAAVAALIFSFQFWLNRRNVKILGFAAYLLAFGAGYAADSYCVYQIPRAVGAEIKLERDFYPDTVTDHPFLLTVQAAEEGAENRLLYKLQTSFSLEALTSGRTLYWKAYLRELNLWGHKGNARFWGGGHMPHNGFIQILYRYGIFAIVPYLLMVLFNSWFAIRYFRRNLFEKKYAFFVLSNMVCCNMLLLVENLERPFVWICWYGMYVVMGVYFDDEKGNLRVRR